MDESTLTEHLLELSRSLDEYRAAVKKVQDHFAFEIEELWKDQADLRDEVNANVTALGNRVESLTRARLTEPAEVAERLSACTCGHGFDHHRLTNEGGFRPCFTEGCDCDHYIPRQMIAGGGAA